jgi:hypothetical protein
MVYDLPRKSVGNKTMKHESPIETISTGIPIPSPPVRWKPFIPFSYGPTFVINYGFKTASKRNYHRIISSATSRASIVSIIPAI